MTSRRQIDTTLLFAARIVRLFAFGALSIVLALYLEAIGFTPGRIGLVFTITLAGDAALSLAMATWADRLGRRRMLVAGAGLLALAGATMAITRSPLAVVIVAFVGVLSPSGNEAGPFLSIEQAALAQILPDDRRTRAFGWYSMAGSFATAAGALAGGGASRLLQEGGHSAVESYRFVLGGYAACGVALGLIFLAVSAAVEPARQPSARAALGLTRSKKTVLKLSALFGLDAFGGGFVVQSIVAYWFHLRFGVDVAALGAIFFVANALAGLSAPVAARLAARFGLVETMVFTHIPSNLLLCLVPLMPDARLATGVLLARFAISQMDVPTRQSYTMAVVDPDERSAAAGITSTARSIGAAIAPSLSGSLIAIPAMMSAPFLIAGGLKIVYDLLLYRSFRALRPPEERG
ncbi:MAG: MFS transporter [Thermoanaerobaculia bacterium]